MKKEYLIFGGLALVGLTLTVLIVRAKKGTLSVGSAWLKPVEGPLTSGFGKRKDPTNPTATQDHNGQDIAVPTGTPVKAPRNGVVMNTTPTTGGGNQIVLQHDNGWFTGYAHLSKVLVTKGQKVKKGQIIALSGATGAHVTGPHLHFTLTDEKGNKIDPKLYVYK